MGALGTPNDVVVYSYREEGWGDLLTAYDGQQITYDNQGRLLNDGTWQYYWTHGRQIATMTGEDDNWNFTYDANGMRIWRSNGDTTYKYVYDGSQLRQMTVGNHTLYFTYDASGTPLAVTYEGFTLYYLTNLQGDVVAILSSTGTAIVNYTYDAWGNGTVTYNENLPALSHLLGDLNPLRYRGYVYDTETGLYYLQSRYYNPKWGRFISADNNFSNLNLFIYCGNNPGNGIDPNGEHWYCLWMDDLANWVKELAACVSNIVYGKAAYERSFYDSKGARELWRSRPFQDVKPSQEMQVFTEFVYNQDVVVDVSISVDTPINNTYVKIGTSKVLSPSENINASYLHAGVGVSTPSLSPVSISFSVGKVNNMNAKEDYTKGSWNLGAVGGYGFDYSWSKGNINAYSFTVSNTYGASLGYDYYWCIN